jgi:hypothetical protein
MMGAIDMMNILGVAAGAVAAGMADKFIPESIDKRISAAGKIAIGVLLPNMVKSGKMKNALAGVGSGFIAVGAVDLLKGFGVLSGANDSDYLEVTLNGGVNVLAGEDINIVSGDQDILAGEDISIVSGMDDNEY